MSSFEHTQRGCETHCIKLFSMQEWGGQSFEIRKENKYEKEET